MIEDRLTRAERIRLESFAQAANMANGRLIPGELVFQKALEIEQFLLAAETAHATH